MFQISKRRMNEFAQISKKLDITVDEYVNFYEKLTKTNAKTQRMRKNGNALYAPKYSTANPFKSISDRGEFEARLEQFRYILQPGFRQVENMDRRRIFIDNLQEMIGTGATAQKVYKIFNNLTDKQFKEFLEANPDLGALAYGSPDDVKKFIDEQAEVTLSRLEELGLGK